jgi:hypothetical protein
LYRARKRVLTKKIIKREAWVACAVSALPLAAAAPGAIGPLGNSALEISIIIIIFMKK